MEFFYVKEDFHLDVNLVDGSIKKIQFIKPKDKPTFESIYVSTGACLAFIRGQAGLTDKVVRLANDANRKQIFDHPTFPKIVNDPYYSKDIQEYDFNHDKRIQNDDINWKPYTPKPDEKIYIINGMGTGLGDGCVGIRALQIFEEKHKVKPILGTVFVVADRDHVQMYESNGFTQQFTPITLKELMEYDSVCDFSALAIQSGFNQLNFIDYYLKSLGIDPDSIPANDKKNQLPLLQTLEPGIQKIMDDLKTKKKKIVGLKLDASTPIRSLSRDQYARAIKDILLDNPKNHVFFFDNAPGTPTNNPGILSPDDMKKITVIAGQDYYQLLHILSRLDSLITIDSCFYHFANAFDIPTLVLFTIIPPDIRLTYYNNCKGILISPEHKLLGKHLSLNDLDYKYHYEHIKNFRLKKHLHLLNSITLPHRKAI